MPKKCHTNPGEEWISKVGGGPDGRFTVDSEDNTGDFEGHHSGDAIKGHCSGSEISYSRPYNRPRFHYQGKFNSGGDTIKGTRGLRGADRGVKVTDDEEWTATKTTKSVKKARKG